MKSNLHIILMFNFYVSKSLASCPLISWRVNNTMGRINIFTKTGKAQWMNLGSFLEYSVLPV
jgi:hypothetical protein